MNTAGCACSARSTSRGADQVHASLQPLEARGPAVLVERDDLAVEHEPAAASGPAASSACDDRRELFRLLVAVARPDVHGRPPWPPARPRRARGCRRTSARRPAPSASAARRPASRASGAGPSGIDARRSADLGSGDVGRAGIELAAIARHANAPCSVSTRQTAPAWRPSSARSSCACSTRCGAAAAEVSVRDLQPEFPGSAYTTLMTTMDRLHRKGVLERRKVGRAFAYRPVSSREQLESGLVDARAAAAAAGRRAPSRSCRSSSKR